MTNPLNPAVRDLRKAADLLPTAHANAWSNLQSPRMSRIGGNQQRRIRPPRHYDHHAMGNYRAALRLLPTLAALIRRHATIPPDPPITEWHTTNQAAARIRHLAHTLTTAGTLLPDDAAQAVTATAAAILTHTRRAVGLPRQPTDQEQQMTSEGDIVRRCTTRGCDNQHLAGGHCRMHYQQQYRARTRTG